MSDALGEMCKLDAVLRIGNGALVEAKVPYIPFFILPSHRSYLRGGASVAPVPGLAKAMPNA